MNMTIMNRKYFSTKTNSHISFCRQYLKEKVNIILLFAHALSSLTCKNNNKRMHSYEPELEQVRQSGSGPAGRNRIFTGFFSIFLPDFCRIFVSLTSKMNRTDFYRIFAGFTSKMIRPDFDRTGPEKFWSWPDRTGCKKIRPVPTLVWTKVSFD